MNGADIGLAWVERQSDRKFSGNKSVVGVGAGIARAFIGSLELHGVIKRIIERIEQSGGAQFVDAG